MSRATLGFWAGIALMGIFGWLLLKAARTDTIWVRKLGRYWHMHRRENPRAFWMNIIGFMFAFGYGLFLVGWTLISPETVH